MTAIAELTERCDRLDHYQAGYGLHKLAGDRVAYRAEKAHVERDGIDRGAMSVPCIVTTQDEDRSLDVILTEGIDLRAHQQNPVVNYNHGLSIDLPIGKAMDPGGNYTVTREAGLLRAVTYFSQNLLEAAQVFQLIEEGILNGVSIGAIPGRVEKRAVTNWKGFPGLLVHTCEMFEYSHTSNPDNRQALTDRVLGGRLAGKSISGSLLKSLSPYLLPQPKQVTLTLVGEHAEEFLKSLKGANMATPARKPTPPVRVVRKTAPPVEAEEDEYEPIDQTSTGTAPAKATDTTTEPEKSEDKPIEKVDEPEADPTADFSPGAKLLAGLYDRDMEKASFLETSAKGQENPAIKEYMASKSERMAEDAEEIKTLWKEHYAGDYGDLGGKEEEEGEEEEEEPVEKSLVAKLKKITLPYRKSILASVAGATAKDGELSSIKAENARLADENAKLRKSLEASLDREEKVRREFNLARKGR